MRNKLNTIHSGNLHHVTLLAYAEYGTSIAPWPQLITYTNMGTVENYHIRGNRKRHKRNEAIRKERDRQFVAATARIERLEAVASFGTLQLAPLPADAKRYIYAQYGCLANEMKLGLL